MSFLGGLIPGLGGAMGGAAGGAAAAPMSQAVMGFKSIPMGEGAMKKPDLFRQILGGIGDGLQQQPQGIPDAPMQQSDPFALMRSLGIDLNSNFLGRLGGRR